MKYLPLVLMLSYIFCSGCVKENVTVRVASNRFTSAQDTLFITTEKRRGDGLFLSGVTEGYFTEINDSFPYPIQVPANLQEVQRTQLMTDFRANKEYYIDIIQGTRDDDQIFIVDENNNKSLLDDPVRLFRPIVWETEDNLIKCRYNIEKHNTVIEDSTWLRIGDDPIGIGKCEHLVADILIDEVPYQLGVLVGYSDDFTYSSYPDSLGGESPSVAILSSDSLKRDSIGERDILKKGEILKLGEDYYKYDEVTWFGDTLILIKKDNFHDLVGTQVGMIAPAFTSVTASGDTIHSTNLHDKMIVVVNSCACGNDPRSMEAYYQIQEKFGDLIHIIRLDDGIKDYEEGMQCNMNNPYNDNFFQIYRKAYCSRTSYIINKDNRIIDKFHVVDWEQYLPNLVNYKN